METQIVSDGDLWSARPTDLLSVLWKRYSSDFSTQKIPKRDPKLGLRASALRLKPGPQRNVSTGTLGKPGALVPPDKFCMCHQWLRSAQS